MNDQSHSESHTQRARILKYPDGQAPAQSVEVLKALFDRIVADCGISKARWGKLANSYIRDKAIEEGLGENVNLVEERSSLNKDFVTQTKMTWRKFCRAMQFVRARRFRLSVTIEHASGRFTEHGLWVTVNSELTADPELDDDIAIPIEIEIANDAQAIPPSGRLHVPPPDIRQFARKYPASPNEGSHPPVSGKGGNPKP